MTKYASVLIVKPKTTMTTIQWQSNKNGWKRRWEHGQKNNRRTGHAEVISNLLLFYVTKYVAKDTNKSNQLISTIRVLFVNGCAGPASSVGADDPGNDRTENQEDGRDQRIRLPREGRTIIQLTQAVIHCLRLENWQSPPPPSPSVLLWFYLKCF